MSFIAKQPNGLYCIFDDIDDQPKKWNMSKEDYIKICIKNARKRAIQELKNAHEFKDVYDSFMQDENMTVEDFNKFLKEVGCKYDYDTLMGVWDDQEGECINGE